MLRRELLVDQYEAIAMYMKAPQTMTMSQAGVGTVPVMINPLSGDINLPSCIYNLFSQLVSYTSL